jgi:hypothetical protein
MMHGIDTIKPYIEKSQSEMKIYRDVLTNGGNKHAREFFR